MDIKINRTFLQTLFLLLGAKLHAGTPATPKVQQMLPSGKEWAFVENKGQLADPEGKLLGDILYYVKQGGVSLYLRQGRIVKIWQYQVYYSLSGSGTYLEKKWQNLPEHKQSLAANQRLNSHNM